LLKDFGTTATMAAIRAAAINSEISFQEYRKTMMEVVARAEAAYWDVYLAQQQFAFATDSVKVANTILQDNRARLGVGKSSELDVMQAEAGVAERQATQNEALQKVHESINRAMVFYSSSSLGTADRLKVVDEPKNEPVDTDVNKYRFLAIDNNPDFLTARKQLKLDDVRIAYAKNQRLPQFDLKGSFGSSGIGGSPRDTFNDIDRAMYPAWTFGVELRLPIGGNIRATKELEAAKLRKETSELTLQTLCVQLDNSIDSARKNAQVFYENTKSFEKVVEFNQNLLNTQLARLEVGKVDSRTVLETEKDLFEAKLGLVQTMIRGKRAIIDLETTVGMTLSSRNLEYTQKQLSERTSALLRASRVTPQALQQYSEMKAREVEARKPAAKP
jgi:outer membrane protein TolC